jgi:HAD superfamily hydrolase (TIGR01450 family)
MTPILPAAPVDCSIDDLIARYDVFLLDAYGVLVTTCGPIAGAGAFLERLSREGREWMIVSNDASRSIASTTARYLGFGLPVTPERVLTSGALLPSYFDREGLSGARCVVIGTEDSRDFVRAAGGHVVGPDDAHASVCVVCGVYDEPGAPFLETLNRTISLVMRRLGLGLPMRFVLPNPDIVYPSDTETFAFTAGGVAALFEAVIRLRDPEAAYRFEPLGKPYAPIFHAAFERLGHPDPRRVVMIGDQLVTDVLGAVRAGIDSVLIETGVSQRSDLDRSPVQPTWLLRTLEEPTSR